MKLDVRKLFLALALFSIGSITGKASTLTWTNIAGGAWNVAANWVPAQVPVNGDDVIITNSGNYTVTNTASVTLDKLTLGGTNGTQILMISSLTLTNAGLVSSNGVLSWNGGDLEGALTVAPGGTLIQSNTLHFAYENFTLGYSNTAYLTNYGTVIWAGSIDAAANATTHAGGGVIDNAGVWDAVADLSIGFYNGAGTDYFVNIGTLEKTAGTGTSTINWNFSSSDVIDTDSGTFSLNWSGPSVLNGNLTLIGTIASSLTVANNAILTLTSSVDLEGALTIAPGGTLIQSNTLHFAYENYSVGYTNTAYLTNYGTVVWAGSMDGARNATTHAGGGVIYNAGLWDAVGDVSITLYNGAGTNYFINLGTLEKTGGTGTSAINWMLNNDGGTINTPSGAFSMGAWIGNGVLHGSATFLGGTITGTLASDCTVNSSATIDGAMFISAGAVANWNGGDLEGALTVEPGGTLTQSNTLHFVYDNYASGYTNTAYLTNYGTVIWAGSIDAAANSTTRGGGGVIDNAGLWNAVADLSIGFYNGSGTNYFINSGTLEKTAATGISTIGWNFSSSGIIDTYSGTFNLNWGGPSVLNGNLALNGTITAPLTVASNAMLTLFSSVDLESSLTVAQGGTLIQSNTLHFAYENYSFGYTNTAYLTNYGTVIWAGSIDAAANNTTHGGGGVIYNAGLWDAVADLSMGAYNGGGTNYFINAGTLEKTAATGTSTIAWTFDSTGGTLETASGYFTFSGIWTPDSMTFGTATILQNIGGIIGSNGVITWLGGDLESSLTVAQGGTLIQSNTLHFAYNNYTFLYTNTAYLTNYGTVIWAGSIDASANNTTHGGGGVIYNAGLWNAVADLSMSVYTGAGTNYFINPGTLEKTRGNGISAISWTVQNSGVIGSQTNTLSLTGKYNLSAGTVNSGINGPGNCGIVNLSGSPATLAGSVSANFNNGYVPIGGNSFTNVHYSSFTGIFTNTILPFADAWSTNYAPGYFVLNVLNARPVMTAPATNQFVVMELSALNVTNQATDADIPAQALTYSIATGYINGMAVNPITGVFAWTPQQTNSPATNTVAIAVTDNGTPPLSATNTFTVIVQEVNVPPSLPTVTTQIVSELALLTVNNTATNFNIHSIITGYTLVNPPAGMSISANGVITWTPSQTESPGTNLITTIVANSNPYDLNDPTLTSTNSFTVIVKEVNVPPSLPTVATQIVNELTLLTVNNTATNFNIHSTITGYTLVAPPSNMAISASGIITWTPAQTQSPATNFITTIVTNSNPFDLTNPWLTATNTFTLIVKEVNTAPSLAAISTETATLLELFSITNSATESNIHSTNAGYLLISSPSGMVINSNGVINWTPAAYQSLTTNTVTTVATNGNPYDLINPYLAVTNSFQVVVVPNLGATTITRSLVNGADLDLSWPADHTGWRLEVQTNTLAQGIGTNWTTFSGSSATNEEIITMVSTNGTVFFRMTYP